MLLDNGVHDSTGGQATVSPVVDFAGVALACGYPLAVTCDDLPGFDQAFRTALASDGPALLHARIRPGSMDKLGSADDRPARGGAAVPGLPGPAGSIRRRLSWTAPMTLRSSMALGTLAGLGLAAWLLTSAGVAAVGSCWPGRAGGSARSSCSTPSKSCSRPWPGARSPAVVRPVVGRGYNPSCSTT